MTPYIHVSSAPKGTEEKKNRSVLPAFVSHSPFSLDCVFFPSSLRLLMEVAQRDLTCQHPLRILSAYLTRFSVQLPVFPVGYLVDFCWIGSR